MAIDARIPLTGQSPDLVGSYSKGLGAASKLQDLQLQPKRNQLIDLQMQGQKDKNRSTGATADMDELKSQYMPVAMVARKISQVGGANAQNAAQINDLIVNSGAPQQSIDESLKLLNEGNYDAVNAQTANILQTAQDLQIFGAPKDDSFTLKEGQSRYNKDGSVLVENAKDPSEITLSVNMEKRLSKANDRAIEAGSNSVEFQELASQIEASEIKGGLFGATWSEKFKEATGNQDAVSALRKRYYAIRSSEAVKNLPPGVASDKDIELALKGFPGDKANKEEIASFLRGMAKLESAENKYNTFVANHISTTGGEIGMLKAWRDSQKPDKGGKGGKDIPEGYTLQEDANGNRAYVNAAGDVIEVQQ